MVRDLVRGRRKGHSPSTVPALLLPVAVALRSNYRTAGYSWDSCLPSTCDRASIGSFIWTAGDWWRTYSDANPNLMESGLSTARAVGTTLVCVVLGAVFGSLSYAASGSVDYQAAGSILLGSLAGSYLGG